MSNLRFDLLQGLQGENPMDIDMDFIPLMSDEDEESIGKSDVPELLPILPLRNSVLFPGAMIPISVSREKSIRLIREVYAGKKVLGAVAQKDTNTENPTYNDLYTTGTVAYIVKILEMPGGGTMVIMQGRKRFKLESVVSEDPYIQASISELNDSKPLVGDQEYEAIVGSLKDLSLKIINLSVNIPQEASFAVKNIESSTFLINFISSNSNIGIEDKQALLEIGDLKQRAVKLLEHLSKEVQMLELKNVIQSKVKTELDQQQREYLLQQQMKTIQNELGGNTSDKEIEDFKKRSESMKWSQEIAKHYKKELEKMQRLNPASPEYSVQMNYLSLLLDLPWNIYSEDNYDLKRAAKILDQDHFGLEKVKERILEHLAVLKLRKDLKAPIICLVGPPGVGKTSLGKSIANALNRKYLRMSLGGLHDEAEIRGHRKTYIGAMPGRIIQNLKKAGTANPVFILDEIDKVGNDFRGDPSSALLEVLDPEQNSTFYDNYLEVDFDLSKVMFIATANTLSTISAPLRDRMEVIDISGYLLEEKIEIAKRHLISKQLDENGVSKKLIQIPAPTLEYIIENHTHESGVRQLEKQIAKIIRSKAKLIAMDEKFEKVINPQDVPKILGIPGYNKEKYQGNDFAGVATGLAWTAAGGDILYIETSISKGKGDLTTTGNLGDVMKESARIAFEYIKSHARDLEIRPDFFEKYSFHLHVPEGAIPKDGPSAGITMVTSMLSAILQSKIKSKLAMTGEITLRGKVLPVGGIKEKILAAKRAGITDIILCNENKKDISEIKEIYLKGLRFHYAETIQDVLAIALTRQKVKNPLLLN